MVHTLPLRLIALALAAPIVGLSGPVPARSECVLPPAGLVHWWPGDGNAKDVIGGYDGTLQNGATFATGESIRVVFI